MKTLCFALILSASALVFGGTAEAAPNGHRHHGTHNGTHNGNHGGIRHHDVRRGYYRNGVFYYYDAEDGDGTTVYQGTYAPNRVRIHHHHGHRRR